MKYDSLLAPSLALLALSFGGGCVSSQWYRVHEEVVNEPKAQWIDARIETADFDAEAGFLGLQVAVKREVVLETVTTTHFRHEFDHVSAVASGFNEAGFGSLLILPYTLAADVLMWVFTGPTTYLLPEPKPAPVAPSVREDASASWVPMPHAKAFLAIQTDGDERSLKADINGKFEIDLQGVAQEALRQGLAPLTLELTLEELPEFSMEAQLSIEDLLQAVRLEMGGTQGERIDYWQALLDSVPSSNAELIQALRDELEGLRRRSG